jgi:ferredoxin-thioredoxin reductase catalytic subunit
MVTPLPPPGAGSSLHERAPQTIITPGGMTLTLPAANTAPPSPASSNDPDHCCSDWDQFFQLIVQFKQREGHYNVPVYHIESGKKLWVWLMVQNIDLKKGTMGRVRKDLFESLGVDSNPQGNFLDFIWDFYFLLLLQFRGREGHLNVPVRHVEDGLNLGNWIKRNRTQKRKEKLNIELERRLNQIGFVWKAKEVKHYAPQHWDTMFKALAQFKQREGHLRVPTRHVEQGGKNLGTWIKINRAQKRKGTLHPELERRFNEIGFIWNGNEGTHSEHWESMFRALAQFKQREGHLRVPTRHVEQGSQNLGNWIKMNRGQKRKGTLCPDLERRLNEIGFIWHANEGTHSEHWDSMFRALAQFKQREGHLRVPTRHVEQGGQNLGTWIKMNRAEKRKGTLCPELERRLNEIGFIWNADEGTYSKHWDSMFRALAQFKQREGHLIVPTGHVTDGAVKVKLGAWVKNQRDRQAGGTLDAKKEKRLETLGVKWTT